MIKVQSLFIYLVFLDFVAVLLLVEVELFLALDDLLPDDLDDDDRELLDDLDEEDLDEEGFLPPRLPEGLEASGRIGAPYMSSSSKSCFGASGSTSS